MFYVTFYNTYQTTPNRLPPTEPNYMGFQRLGKYVLPDIVHKSIILQFIPTYPVLRRLIKLVGFLTTSNVTLVDLHPLLKVL